MPSRPPPPAAPPPPEVLGLLGEAKDRPEDTPRLVLADWLEEHGATPAERARAEFIRVQCARACQQGDDRALRRRETALRRRHQREWLGPLYKLTEHDEFRRGLLHITLRPRELTSREFGALAQSGALAWVEGLSIPSMAETTLERLAAQGWVAGLTSLHLAAYYSPLGPRGARALLSSPSLRRLTELSLVGTLLADEGAAVLAEAPHLKRLARLNLHGNRIGAAGAAALARLPQLAGLAALNLGGNRLGPDGAAALAASPHLRRLGELLLSHNGLGDEGVGALAASRLLAGLTTLELAVNNIGPAGAAALAASPHLARLEKLDLRANPLGDEGAAALAASPHLDKLRALDLRACEFRRGAALRRRFGRRVRLPVGLLRA
jgi:uncharacterized protein (TIGR02996 family)